MTGHCCSRSRPTRDHLPPPRPEASDRTFAKRPSFPHRTDLGARPTPADQGREPQGFESRSIFILSAPSEIFLTLCANGRLDRLRKLVRFGPPVRCRPVTHLDDRGAFTVSTGPYALGLCGSCSLETARRGPERTTKLRWETCGKKEHRKVHLDPVPVPHNGREKTQGLFRQRSSGEEGHHLAVASAPTGFALGQTMLRVTSRRLPCRAHRK